MSHIETFRREIEEQGLEKQSDLVITVDGFSGAGKSTLARQISEILQIPRYSAGDFFRSIAEERDMTAYELSEQAEKEVDLEVDRRTLKKGLSEDCVIESRIASRVLGDYSDYRIRLKASLHDRALRVRGREGEDSLDEVKERIKKRDRDNWERYGNYYGLEDDLDIYHLVFDNSDFHPRAQRRIIRRIVGERFGDIE
jgi:cytidylate kinase